MLSTVLSAIRFRTVDSLRKLLRRFILSYLLVRLDDTSYSAFTVNRLRDTEEPPRSQ